MKLSKKKSLLFMVLFVLLSVNVFGLVIDEQERIYDEAAKKKIDGIASGHGLHIVIEIITLEEPIDENTRLRQGLDEIDTLAETHPPPPEANCDPIIVMIEEQMYISPGSCKVNMDFVDYLIDTVRPHDAVTYQSLFEQIVDHFGGMNKVKEELKAEGEKEDIFVPPNLLPFEKELREQISKGPQDIVLEEEVYEEERYIGPINYQKIFLYTAIPIFIIVVCVSFYLQFLRKPAPKQKGQLVQPPPQQPPTPPPQQQYPPYQQYRQYQQYNQQQPPTQPPQQQFQQNQQYRQQ